MKVLFRGKRYTDLPDLVKDLHGRFGYKLKNDVIELLEISGIEPIKTSPMFPRWSLEIRSPVFPVPRNQGYFKK